MASTREAVSFPGTLRGEGYETSCAVSAIKVVLPGSDQFTYTNYSIKSVSQKLPPGLYELFANGTKSSLRHHNGQWLAAF